MAGKLRDLTWKELPRQSQQAAILYPDKVSSSMQRGMLERAREEPHGAKRLWDRMNRDTVPDPPRNYDRIPGLKRVEPKATGPKSWWEK